VISIAKTAGSCAGWTTTVFGRSWHPVPALRKTICSEVAPWPNGQTRRLTPKRKAFESMAQERSPLRLNGGLAILALVFSVTIWVAVVQDQNPERLDLFNDPIPVTW